jgi:hypothetical protein
MTDIQPTLDAIDEAIDGYVSWQGSPDAMVEVNGERGGLEPSDANTWALDSHGRIPYVHLTGDEREAIHEWCHLHQIEHHRVPVDTLIERDGPEWRVEVLHMRDGKAHLGSDGEIVYVVLRRAFKADLPWRKP